MLLASFLSSAALALHSFVPLHPAVATAPVQDGPRTTSLLEARAGFETAIVEPGPEAEALAAPPAELFTLVDYAAPNGPTKAYLSRFDEAAEKLPAIVWLTGGWPVARGGSYIWRTGSFVNEQSATVYREHGIVMLFPTVRGAADNPGVQELFYGEVDDVIAATEYLRGLEQIDPQRIYLGGHSTGGTLALLVAEATDLYRAVFSFGPVPDLADYGGRDWPWDTSNPRELRLRSSIHFLDSITTPTLVIEGTGGNIEDLEKLESINANPLVETLALDRADHFTPLAPINRELARAILADSGPAFDFDLDHLRSSYAAAWHAPREARDLQVLGDLRAAGAEWGAPHRFTFSLRSRSEERLGAARTALAELGFAVEPVRTVPDEDGDPDYRLSAARVVPLEVAGVLALSRQVAELAADGNVVERGWIAEPQ